MGEEEWEEIGGRSAEWRRNMCRCRVEWNTFCKQAECLEWEVGVEVREERGTPFQVCTGRSCRGGRGEERGNGSFPQDQRRPTWTPRRRIRVQRTHREERGTEARERESKCTRWRRCRQRWW